MPRASSVLCLVLHSEQSHEEATQAVTAVTRSPAVICHGEISFVYWSITLSTITDALCRLISAVAVTIPSCYFLWPESHEGAGHGAHVMAHAGTHTEEEAQEAKEDDAPADEPKEDETPKEDESKDEKPKEEAPKEEKSEDDSSSSEGKPDSTEPEKTSNKKVDGVQFKGKTAAGDENNEMTDERKREPDSKGAFKKRIDSGYQKDLGPVSIKG